MLKWVTVALCTAVLASAGYCTDYDGILQNAKNRALAGDFTTAITLCTSVINAHLGAPIEPRARLLLGHILNKKRGPESDSISQFAQLVARFPNSPEAPQALLRIAYLRERLKQQPAEWERIVANYPRTKEAAEALHCLAHRALRAGNTELAIRLFKASSAVPECEPGCVADTTIEAGYACISQYWKTKDKGALSNALETLRPGITSSSLTQSDIGFNLARGEVYLIQGFGEKAAQEYQAALDQNPSDPYQRGVAVFELGCALYTKNDHAGALSAFTTFLNEQQGDTLADKDRGWKQARPGYSTLRDHGS
jgi:tetratricopeptide (TPR) repeat protein